MLAIRSIEQNQKVSINHGFKKFYEELYTTDSENEGGMEPFFQSLDLPRLAESQKANLDRPITIEEICRVIRGIPSVKSPGPDDFTSECFNCYASELTPLLLSMYNEAFKKGLSATSLKALIILILKKIHVTVRTLSNFPHFIGYQNFVQS